MPSVEIFLDEAEDEILPRVCLKCGQPATHFTRKTFCCAPSPFNMPLIELIFGKRLTVHMPLCDSHRFHWLTYTVVGVGGFAMLLGGLVIGMTAAINQASASAQDATVFYVMMSSVVFFSLWSFALLYLHNTRIKAFRMTHDWMQLMGVSEAFRDALADKRDEEDDDPVDHDRRANLNDEAAKKRRSRLIRSLFGGGTQSCPEDIHPEPPGGRGTSNGYREDP